MTNHESLGAVRTHTHTPYLYKECMEKLISLEEKNNLQNNFNFCKQKGITLIALVITIVVLLILAGVTINLLFSDTGLLGKAQEAKNTWENAENSDREAIGELSNQMDEILNGIGTGSGGGTSPSEPEEIVDITTLTQIQTKNTKGKDAYGNIVMIPKGFKVVTSEATTVPEGIVIEDDTATDTTAGNQFVWIPVGTVYKNEEKTDSATIQLGRYTFDTNTGEPTPVQLAFTEEKPNNYTNEITIEHEDNEYIEVDETRKGIINIEKPINNLNATAKNLSKFVQSVKNNGGYYIARYEASYGSGYNSNGSTEEEKYANAKPLSKISTDNNTSNMNYTNGILWNFITQMNASKVCQNMYANDDMVGVESDLANSYAWDTAIVFIQEMDEANSNYANKTDGNGTLENTGMTEDMACNLFNMSSNLREWTTEYCTSIVESKAAASCSRGGYYVDIAYTAGRYNNYVDNYSERVGFRPILYIN